MTDQALPVTMRPPLLPILGLGVVAVLQPSRRGSLLLAGLAAGPTSRLALVSYGIAAAGLVLSGLVARTYVALDRRADGHLVLLHQGLVHRREVTLSAAHQIRLVSGPAARAIIVEDDGAVAGTVSAFIKFWRRDDVGAALATAGLELTHEHTLNRAADVEAAYPGTTAWIERHPVWLTTLLCLVTTAAVFFLAWLLEF